MNEKLLAVLHDLVFAFEDEIGCSSNVVDATHLLTVSVLGVPADKVFNRALDAVDGVFYFPEGVKAETVWSAMLEAK